VTIDGMAVDVPATIGLTVVDVPTPPGSVMRDADIALYRAKEAGKGRVVQFDPSMRWAAYERLRMRTQLAGALDAGHLRLVFQPIVELGSARIAGGEALLRWDDPDLGSIPPSEFIAIAEESGLILSIGKWAIERACRYAMQWGDNDPDGIYVSVNVSARQLREPEFARHVEDALRRTGLDPRRLMLELTETVLIDEIAARHLSEQIVPLGVRIAIDDFGTGYSSLAYLQRFPVDVVKIDKSFVAQIDRDGMRAVIESIAAIAVVMGYSSIAEGVETQTQLEQLVGFNCGFGQGYHYSEPLDPDSFLERIATRVLVP
jgi:EAL domain-containing protein (putative c-di-GMP-specific phosphodiesterase class I)